MTALNTQETNAFDVEKMASLRHWGHLEQGPTLKDIEAEAIVDCGWGRLIFGQTFGTPEMLAAALKNEHPGQRDVALYMRDPHLVLACAPQDLFIDPSFTFRLPLDRPALENLALDKSAQESTSQNGLRIRAADPVADESEIIRICQTRYMVPMREGFLTEVQDSPVLRVLVAEDTLSNQIVGVVTGVDHKEAFNDPDNGSSLWALAVDPQAPLVGVGEALTRHLAREFQAKGRAFMDLSVMHDNHQAIALYEKLGFERVPVYCLKNRNSINEKLYIGPSPEDSLNIYARIIVDEARRRGISVQVDDAESGLFTLSLGGRSVACREALSELTSAVAMSRCDDKAATLRILKAAGLETPDFIIAGNEQDASAFLQKHGRVVVKPARGEQGRGVAVDLRSEMEMRQAIDHAGELCEKVIVEQFVEGIDLRVIVIDNRVIAGAIRKPPEILGTGQHSIRELIEKQSRSRSAATEGESEIPLDEETTRCITQAGYDLDDILPEGTQLTVRKTANLHTGGTIHDVTDLLHPELLDAAVKAAQALDIPVVGLDMLIPSITGPGHVIIEANERPGLANHEPQPTVERYIDLLFPQSKANNHY